MYVAAGVIRSSYTLSEVDIVGEHWIPFQTVYNSVKSVLLKQCTYRKQRDRQSGVNEIALASKRWHVESNHRHPDRQSGVPAYKPPPPLTPPPPILLNNTLLSYTLRGAHDVCFSSEKRVHANHIRLNPLQCSLCTTPTIAHPQTLSHA